MGKEKGEDVIRSLDTGPFKPQEKERRKFHSEAKEKMKTKRGCEISGGERLDGGGDPSAVINDSIMISEAFYFSHIVG